MAFRIGAIVVSPKTGEPFFCVVEDTPGSEFQIFKLSGSWEGAGTFETHEFSIQHVSAAVSGYPRIHTNYGVANKGVGNGTALYVGGACAVKVRDDRDNDDLSAKAWPLQTGVESGDRKAGVSSPRARSTSAELWWSRAVEVGLAETAEFDAREEKDFSRCVGNSEALSIAREYFDVDPDDASSMEVCANGTVLEGHFVEGNILRYGTARSMNLVIGLAAKSPLEWVESDDGEYTSKTIRLDGKRWDFFNANAALSVNVGVFNSYDDPVSAFNVWVSICKANGIGDGDIDTLRDRFQEGFDIKPSAVMGVDDPRKNPSQRTKADKFAGIVKSYAPARRKNPVPRRNAAPTSAIIKSAEQLAEERRRLGWQRFANLP